MWGDNMKRQVRICIFCGAVLLLAAAFLLFMNTSAKQQTKEEKIAGTDAEETEQSLQASREVTAEYKYLLREEDGQLSVYCTDKDTLFLDTGIRMADLPQYVQVRVNEGLGFDSEEELFAFLESYSS